MSEIQTKDKLITLEELGAAIDAKAGVTSINNQTGAVSLTPADIGAAADSAAMQYRGFYPNGQSMFSLAPGYYTTTDNNKPSEGLPSYGTAYGELSISHTSYYPQIVFTSVLKDFSYWGNNEGQWVVLQREGVTPVTSGGTGMTGCTPINYTTIISDDGRTRAYSWGMICVVNIAGYNLTDITADVTPILSISDSNYFPSYNIGSTFVTINGTPFLAQLLPNGQIKSVRNINANTWIYGQIVWLRGV